MSPGREGKTGPREVGGDWEVESREGVSANKLGDPTREKTWGEGEFRRPIPWKGRSGVLPGAGPRALLGIRAE